MHEFENIEFKVIKLSKSQVEHLMTGRKLQFRPWGNDIEMTMQFSHEGKPCISDGYENWYFIFKDSSMNYWVLSESTSPVETCPREDFFLLPYEYVVAKFIGKRWITNSVSI